MPLARIVVVLHAIVSSGTGIIAKRVPCATDPRRTTGAIERLRLGAGKSAEMIHERIFFSGRCAGHDTNECLVGMTRTRAQARGRLHARIGTIGHACSLPPGDKCFIGVTTRRSSRIGMFDLAVCVSA
ncbi:hypothetical protein WK25_24900 [Burkholderia latens]|nr:hypothetical protein WK25_24900 [Burkholderia latens]